VSASPVPAPQAMSPFPSAEVINGTAAMLSAPRPCPPREFCLPPEFCLMRNVPHQHVDVNRYPAAIKPKKLRPQQISVSPLFLLCIFERQVVYHHAVMENLVMDRTCSQHV
jgi:hypothetical protein